MCQTERGCPIKAIAQDTEITRVCRVYMRARNLLEYPHLQEMGHELLKKEGIRDSSLLILLEGVVQDYRKEKREQEKRIEEAKSLAKKGGGL